MNKAIAGNWDFSMWTFGEIGKLRFYGNITGLNLSSAR